MGMFDTVYVDNFIKLNDNLPPILPFRYQTKSLDSNLAEYDLEDIINNFNLKKLRLYNIFDEKDLLEILRKDSKREILFNIDIFSKCVLSGWIEYHLEISEKEIKNIKLIDNRHH